MTDQSLSVLKEINEQLLQLNLQLKKQILHRKKVVTFEEGCEGILGIATSYGYKISSRLPTYCPTGKKLYFRKSELEDWCLQNRQSTDSELEQQSINYITKNPLKHVI